MTGWLAYVHLRSTSVARRRASALAATAAVLSPVLWFAAPATASGTACSARVVEGVIPSWAQAGFNPPNQRMHYELGSKDQIVALLFAYPLLAPPPKSHSNKILWVSKSWGNGSPLLIKAQRLYGPNPVGDVVQRQVAGGPGPSIIDLPTAGCWQLDLEWSGHHDTVDLPYLND